MVISERYPYVEIVINIGTMILVDEAYIDTGFEAGLLIPAYLEYEILAGSY